MNTKPSLPSTSPRQNAVDEPRHSSVGATAGASPNRLMSAFLAQKTRLLTALNDEGGLFECRFLGRLLERSTAGITTAHTGAVEIHTGLAELRQQLLLDLALDDDTPAVLDPQEQSRLLKLMARLGLTTRHHEGQLKSLT